MRVCFWNLVRTKPEDRDHAAVREAAARLAKEYAKVDQVLARQAFLGGDEFTMGDIPLGCHVN